MRLPPDSVIERDALDIADPVPEEAGVARGGGARGRHETQRT